MSSISINYCDEENDASLNLRIQKFHNSDLKEKISQVPGQFKSSNIPESSHSEADKIEYEHAIITANNEENKEETHLTDLPNDILSLIYGHLNCGDFVNFRLICKPFLSVDPERIQRDYSLSDQTPCLMVKYDRLYHPLYNTYFDKDIGMLSLSRIHDSKYGWFLMTSGYYEVFFYNPITEIRIDLPDIPYNTDGHISMSFSSPPTSLECQVIIVTPVLSKTAEIFILNRNEDWQTLNFPVTRHFWSSECNPILYKGVYYILGRLGNLMIYDPTENKCNFTGCDNKVLKKKLGRSYHRSYMVESDGDLLAVFVGCDARSVGVFKLNPSSMIFEKIFNLENKMLFVSHGACFAETAVISGTGNKIYLPMFHENNGLFYSLGTKKFHTFNEESYSSDHFHGVKWKPLDIWIKPIYDTTCEEEFDW